MNETDFLPELRNEIMSFGYDRRTAAHYAVLIGDTPVRDGHGNYLVMDGGKVLATLPPLKCFAEPQ